MQRTDYATGKPVQDGPEESVRQDFEVILIDDYGYRKNQLDIRVPIRRGRSVVEEADIVVYADASGRDQAKDILGIIETKRPGDNSGAEQIKSYMTATSAQWGVLTNGDNIHYFAKPPGTVAVSEDYLHNIPARGQRLVDVGTLSKADLKPYGRTELKTAFRRVLNTLYANTNISRREKLGSEMTKLIFAKIQDERTYLDQEPRFRAGAGEDPEAVKARVVDLFAEVMTDLAPDGIFNIHDTITLDAKGVAWVVGQLERGSLTDTDTDVVGDAFEVFAESKMVGEKGEFFTPRGVVHLAVRLVSPRPRQTIFDPACGSGGFLIAAMKHIWSKMETAAEWRGQTDTDFARSKEQMASQHIFGLDKESDLVRIARAYMAISGDGRSNLQHDNSLHAVDELHPTFTRDGELRRFDIILTNPPYGTKTKVLESHARHYQLGRSKSGKPRATDPYVLFIERSLDMLNDGGQLAIVLPETVFHGPSKDLIRAHIAGRAAIEAVIELPHNTFRPYCNAKTCLLVARKGAPQQRVVMAAPTEMGHDHNGRELYRNDAPSEIWDDLPQVIAELGDPDNDKNEFVFTTDWQALVDAGHWMPRYFWAKRQPPKLPEGRCMVSLQTLLDEGVIQAFPGHGSPPAKHKGTGDVPYVRVADIVNWEIYRNPTALMPTTVFTEYTRGRHTLIEGDVLFVTRGSYRIGSVAMASYRDTKVILTREILTLRVVEPNDYAMTPYYLLALLSSQPVQNQIDPMVFLDTTMPTISNRWRELQLPIHTDRSKIPKMSDQVEEAVSHKWNAQRNIQKLRETLGDITT
ncbi:MAG: N-6 DNA methylase [Acidimicrobiaceae bacterium]|nr:N-6 DNA methylase [Acidimicrobiia bacterium]MCY4494195.1 N-6 DNA methylase [Acidimicrobiaceae bacterium]